MNANVDPGEIRKFEKLAARWWDPNSEFKPLHDINPLRVDYILERTAMKDRRVLDVGCGGGLLTEALAHAGAQVTGIDMGKAPLEVARLHLHESALDIDYRQCTAEQLAEEQPGRYDVVTCMEMLEHVPDPAAVIAACATLLQVGGLLFFSTINRTPKSWLFAIVGAEYVLQLLPRGTHDYQKFIRPSELDRWLRANALVMRELCGMHYNPLSQRYWLASGVDVNYLGCSERTPD